MFKYFTREEFVCQSTGENEIEDERKTQKYVTLLSKGLRPSSLEVKDHFLENEKRRLSSKT